MQKGWRTMIISRAPVRLSMGGGGTDLASYYEKFGGFLMAAAVNKYIYIMANKRFNKSIRLSYSKTENVNAVDEISHNIFREALKFTQISQQIELVSVADVSSQCGLGTSSSFTVALLNVLYAFKKEYISLDALAKNACHIEIDILHEPIGKQDQYAASYGGFNAYWFNKDGTVTVEPVQIKDGARMELQSNIFLFYLNMERSAGSILQVQNQKSKDDDKGTLERLHRIKEIGLYTKEIFEKGRIDEFGEILHEHWLTKKKLSDGISTPLIDEIYETARKNGAMGGKVVGAGGGGFLLFYCPQNKSQLIAAMEKYGLSPTWFNFENEGARLIFHS
jgi:D-glycero-alpha-D-manno-heptose-7-phosphate kinase